MTPRQQHYLQAMGIPVWLTRQAAEPEAAVTVVDPEIGTDWTALEAQVAACIRCGLHRTRTQTVFGVGAHNADLMVVGEAPGAEEDRRGEPFVGRAGQLLTAMLKAIGLPRESVYIANILKCRPPNNRDPQPEEAETCTDYLQAQIALIQPKLILAVGRIAGQWLTGSSAPLGKLRLGTYRYGGSDVPLLVTYHPAYLLRSPGQKRLAWQDLKRVRSMLESV